MAQQVELGRRQRDALPVTRHAPPLQVEKWVKGSPVAGFEKGEYAMPSYAGVANDSQVEALVLFIALSLVAVLVFLLRWVAAPQQHRYLYLAWFMCGIAFNNHQSLIVITIASMPAASRSSRASPCCTARAGRSACSRCPATATSSPTTTWRA